MSDVWSSFRQVPNAQSQDADVWSSFRATAPQQSQVQALTEQPLVKKGQELLAQREADINYDVGAPIGVRVALQRADNPNEAKLVLEKQYGVGNYGQDRFGQWWVNQNGQRVSVLPKGVVGGLKNIGTGMVSSGWPMAGAVGGGVLGEAVFPLGGGIPGAMVGAALGKGVDNLIKWAEGTFAKTPTQTVSGMANEGAVAGVFQGAGPLLSKTGQGIKSGLQRFAGVTPTTRTMAQDLSSGGAVPPIGSYAPEATSLEYKRQLRGMLSGNPAEAKNVEYLTKRMDSVFRNEGVSAPEREKLINDIYNTSFRTSAREAGEAITGRARTIQADLLRDFQNIRGQVEKDIMSYDRLLRQFSVAAPSTAQDISQSIVGARRDFSQRMSSLYESIDRMGGEVPRVPTSLIKQQAKELVDIIPDTALPPLLKRWAAGDVPDRITFAQAHALRTTFREMGETIGVTPTGQKIGAIRKLASATDAAIQSTEDTIGQEAAKSLRVADRYYAMGIAKFNNASINRIVKELRSGIVPEPGYVARLIMNSDNPNLARTVFRMLPDAAKTNVIKADLGNMIDAASYRSADGVVRMDGQSLAKALYDRRSVLEATYPPQMISSLRLYANDLAAFDGKIDVTGIKTPTAITNLLERAVGSFRAADEFARTNPIGALASENPAQVDRALARLTMPGNEAVTNQAVKTLGIDSQEWKSVRKYALQRLFSGSVTEKQSLAKTISGMEIDKALNRYTQRQQDLLFPHGLADDLRILARESKFLFPHQANEFGTSLAAASIKSGLWLNPLAVYKYVRTSVMGYIADHPKLLRFLTSEIRNNPERGRSTLSVVGQWLTERALLGGPGKGRPDMPKDQPEVPAYGGPVE